MADVTCPLCVEDLDALLADKQLPSELAGIFEEPARMVELSDGYEVELTEAEAQVEFPGFGGYPVTAVSEPLRTALGSRRLGDCGGGSDCRSYRCSRRHRSGRALGSCRSAS